MKKGSLSLSVNAIVVLILAITMLGLGLGFMKGMFGKVTENVEDAITATELQYKASRDDPITLSWKDATITRGTTKRMDVGYFNIYSKDATLTLTASCKGNPDYITLTVPDSKSAKVNQEAAFSILVEVETFGTSGTNLCTAKIVSKYETTELGTLSKDFFITIP